MNAKHIAVAAIVLDTAGVIIPIRVLTGDSRPETQTGVMVSGTIVMGCGAIATAISVK